MIKVVDAVCGSGKSSQMISHMRSHPQRKYLYISPILSEAEERIPSALPSLNFKFPAIDHYDEEAGIDLKASSTKTESILTLIQRGENIASTHSLFHRFTDEIIDILIDKQYCLIIDEDIASLGLINEQYNRSDMQALITGDFIQIDSEHRDRVVWNESKYPNHTGKYGHVRQSAMLGGLYAFRTYFLVIEYPPRLLAGLEDIYVLTYLFHCSDMRYWLELNHLKYEYVDLEQFGLTHLDQVHSRIKDNLSFIDNRNLSALYAEQKNSDLSASWYKDATKALVLPYKKVMVSTVTNHLEGGKVFWTVFKKRKPWMEGKGYTAPIGGLPPFLPKNSRAINNYADYNLCMYACNSYRNPIICQYVSTQGVEFDRNSNSLADCLQFIFRGAIRNGNKQKTLILSRRMRELVEQWRDRL
jgi:hypothetical protein